MFAPIILTAVSTFLAITSVVASPAAPVPLKCHEDNCLRGLLDGSPSEISEYCSAHLSTSIAPLIKAALVTTAETVTPASQTITAAEATVTTYLSTAYTTTVTTALDKRAVETPTYPAFARHCSDVGTLDKAVRLTSACSCLLVNTPPVTAMTSTRTSTVVAPTLAPVVTVFPISTETITVYTTTVWVYVSPPKGCKTIPCTVTSS